MTDLPRRAFAELLGSAFLVATVIGSGVAASRLSPGQPGLQLLESAVATGTVLVALILALQPVSAAFNPVITLVERGLGQIGNRIATVLVLAQLVGAAIGAVVANLMFALPAATVAHQQRSGGGVWLGEVVATLGLVLVVFGTAGSDKVAFAVGGYITGAYWFTSSTSFANPAVTLGRTLSDSFSGIAPAAAPMFVLMQLIGGMLGLGAVRLLHTRPSPEPT